MNSDQISTKSYVQITIQVPTGVYGKTASMDEIIKQSSVEGKNAVYKVCNDKGWNIVSEPKVTTVSTFD